MAKRGVPVTYETVREWCQKFGSLYALLLRRKRARIGSKWHLDEVFIKMNGVQHYLWRAVDQDGVVIDILVQPKRDRWAALRFFRKLLHVVARSPRIIITDKLRSYAAAKIADHARYRTSTEPLSEQSSRELASTHPRTRKTNEALQIFGTGSTLSLCVRISQRSLSIAPASSLCNSSPATAQPILSSLEQDRPRGTRCIAPRVSAYLPFLNLGPLS